MRGVITVAVDVGVRRRRGDDRWTGRRGEIGGGIQIYSAGAATDFVRVAGAGRRAYTRSNAVEESITAVATAGGRDTKVYVRPVGILCSRRNITIAVSGTVLDVGVAGVCRAIDGTICPTGVIYAVLKSVTASCCNETSYCGSVAGLLVVAGRVELVAGGLLVAVGMLVLVGGVEVVTGGVVVLPGVLILPGLIEVALVG